MQYIVNELNIKKREEFYNFLISKYKIKNKTSKYNMINNKYPFVIDLDKKTFWICDSITCLACASYNNKIITINEFNKGVII